jgi:ATP-binding cassette, subfamily G (WHITE), member 2
MFTMVQAKRTNIGVALISNPMILFLDEPSSGLDSCTADDVMAVVKTLATTGITVCASIHAPSSTTFRLFDRLLLLLRGQVVYFGHQGMHAGFNTLVIVSPLVVQENCMAWYDS